MANDNPIVGEIDCPNHEHLSRKVVAEVKLSIKRGRLYVNCKGCGINQPCLADYQEFIKHKARFFEEHKHYGMASEAEPIKTETPEPTKTEAPEPIKTEAPEPEENATAEPEEEQKINNFDDEMGFN